MKPGLRQSGKSKRVPRITTCVQRLRALADATRLQVVRELMHGARSVSELQGVLKTEQSLLSHHLRVLRAAGVVVSERAGRGVLYRLAPGVAEIPGTGVLDLGCCVLTFPASARAAVGVARR
ncbi:MAG: ArsR/SmtB family transcription factor [Panacagrimonas sp.]